MIVSITIDLFITITICEWITCDFYFILCNYLAGHWPNIAHTRIILL